MAVEKLQNINCNCANKDSEVNQLKAKVKELSKEIASLNAKIN